MARREYYQQAGARIAADQGRLKDLEAQLADAYQRSEALEERGG